MIQKSTNLNNSLWNIANILIYPVAFLAVTAFFINRMGESVFGEWMLINSYVFIAVNLAGFGLPNSITVHIAEAIGKNNQTKLFAYINASSRIIGQLTLLALLVAVIMTIMLFAGNYFFGEYLWKTIIYATLLIATRFPEILYQSIFKGFEQYGSATIYNLASRLVALIIQIFLVMKGYSLLSLFIISFIVNLIITILQGMSIYRKLKGYKFVLLKRLPERKKIYHFGFWNWLQTNIDVTAFQLDRFLVAYFLGTATLTYYVLASTIANHLHMAYTAVVGWFLPKITRLKAEYSDTVAYFHTIRTFSIAFSLLTIVILFALSKPLLTLWLGADKYVKIIMYFKLFLAFEAFLILSIVPKLYLNGIKQLRFITVIEFIYKTAMIAGMILFFLLFRNAESLIMGQIIALAVFMPLEYFLINKKVLRENTFRESLLTIMPSFLVAVGILSSDWRTSALLIVFSAVVFWQVFLRDHYFTYKLLKE